MSLLSTRTDPIVLDVGLDWRVLGFNALIVCVTTIAFALAPAIRATRRARIAAGGRLSAAATVSPCAKSSLPCRWRCQSSCCPQRRYSSSRCRILRRSTPGSARPRCSSRMSSWTTEGIRARCRAAAQRELTARLAAIPGIESAAHAATPPLGGSMWDTVVRVDDTSGGDQGRNQPQSDQRGVLPRHANGPDRRPRLQRSNTPASPKVAIVNETFARKALGEPMPLGRRVADGAEEFEVVGVVVNSKRSSLREDFRPIVYTAPRKSPNRV